MAIGHVVTRGFGNGTFSGAIKEVVARGFIADSASDTTPDAFVFTDQTDVARSTLTLSNTITVTGIDAPAAISITGGEYKIDEGAFTSSPGSVTVGQQVQVRQTSSASYSTQTDTVLTIGGVSDTFSITTLASLAIVSMTASSTQLSITFTRAVTLGAGYNNSDLVFTADAVEVVLDVNSPVGNSVTFDLGSTIEYGQALLLSHVQPGDGIEATDDGQDLPSFTDQAVTNNVPNPITTTMNQSARQAAFRAITGTSGTYNEDFIAYAESLGHTGTFNELMILFIQGKLTSTNPSLPGLQAEAAADRSKALWTDLGSDVTDLGT